jgi:hypothetical protein
MNLGAGDETLMVGRFIGRDEKQLNLPIVRFGHLASSRAELINQGKDRGCFLQESFLVETHSVPGFSESPVFAWVPEDRVGAPIDPQLRAKYKRQVREHGAEPREFFLGIDWGHLDEQDPAGMSAVVPSWKLLELLNLEQVVEMREREFDRQRVKDEETPHGHLDTKVPKQKTRGGIEIGIPTKDQILGDLKKASRKKKP